MSDIAHRPTPQPSAAEALAALEQGMRTFRAFQDAHKAIAVLAGLEQNQHEARQRLAALQVEADTILDAARAGAASTEAAAQERAAAIVADAQAAADETAERARAAHAQLVDLEAAISAAAAAEREARARRDQLEREIQDGRTELGFIEKRLREAREKIAALKDSIA